MVRIGIVEGEPGVSRVLRLLCENEGLQVFDAGPCILPEFPGNCDSACFPSNTTPDIILVSIVVPRACSGLDIGRKALRRWPDVKLLLTSGSPIDAWGPDAARLFRALPLGRFVFLPKPFGVDQFRDALEQLNSISRSAQP